MPPLPVQLSSLPKAFINAILENDDESSDASPDSVRNTQNNLLNSFVEKEVLFACVQRVDDKIRSVKTEVLKIIQDRQDEFITLYNKSVALRNKIDSLFLEVDNVSREVNNPETGIKPKLLITLEKNRKVKQETQNTICIIETLEYLCELQKSSQRFKEYMKQSRIEEAAGIITQMDRLLESPPINADRKIYILDKLKMQVANMKESLDQYLDDLLDLAISFKNIKDENNENNDNDIIINGVNFTILSTVQNLDIDESATLLTSIFISLLEIGSINIRLSRLKKNLMKFIIIPLLKNRNSWKASIKIVDDVTAKLFIGKSSDDKGDENNNENSKNEDFNNEDSKNKDFNENSKNEDFNNEDSNNEDSNDQDDGVFTSLTTVFKFIYTFMFGGVDQATKQTLILPFASQCSSIFGKFISHDLRDAVINEYLSHVIPTEISEFNQFKKVANAVSRFQAEMRKMEFMRTPHADEDEEEVRTLGSYVARVDVLFIIKKRDKLLELGRKIMLEDNFESLLITEEEEESEIAIEENLEENVNQGTIKSEIAMNENLEETINNEMIKSEDKFSIKTNIDDNSNVGWEVEWNDGWDDEKGWGDENNLLNQNNQDEKSNEEISPQKLEKRLVQYSTSVKSKDLIDLAINTLNEINEIQKFNVKSGKRLYQTTLDLFDLYRAIMPVYHSNNLTNVPSLAMLFRNDCIWIAKQLLIIQDKYSTILSSLNDSDSEDIDKISYNEISDRLRELGDEWYNIQIDKQKSIIKDILEEIGGVQQTANDERFEICQRAMNQVIDTINRLSRIWKGVLRPSEYYSALGTLIDTSLIIMIDNLEDLYDISAEESHQLNLIYSKLFILENLFEPNTIGNHTGSWKRYRQITDILELSFAEIMNRFRASELDCFTTDELEGLICALFADTPLREQNLQEITETRNFF
ncbi:hypothetical protein Glove_208g66 [Diversispora epigaea]|uniref:Uncharacterized protein n=1 Tax=Diversispora epigaea TaxID=1348612 RepID=A0A397INT1_9GLOM|nr:hypothetical protein Glove_208g66 [Diversispora epigaea]